MKTCYTMILFMDTEFYAKGIQGCTCPERNALGALWVSILGYRLKAVRKSVNIERFERMFAAKIC